MRSLSIQWLADSDLPFDWSSILEGLRGIGQRKLSGDKVIEVAHERIGCGTPEQDEIAALLIHADPRDIWTIKRYLEQLAEGETVTRMTALRKWRAAELSNLLIMLEETYERLGSNSKHDLDADIEVNYELLYFWLGYDELPSNSELSIEPFVRFADTRQQCEQWLTAEKAALRDILEKTNQ